MIKADTDRNIEELVEAMYRNGIGNTPFDEIDNGIYAKKEWMNRFGSIKDRAAFFMLYSLKASGYIENGIIEASSGNTGLALSSIARMLGIPATIVLPENASNLTKRRIKENGARLIETAADLGTEGSIEELQRILKRENLTWINQHSNPVNSDAHYYTTGREMIRDYGLPDAVVAGIGTGGTITGLARVFKEKDHAIKIIGVQPSEGSHIPGLRMAFRSKYRGILDRYANLIDEIIIVSEEDAKAEVIRHYRETGDLIGISSGANLYAARTVQSKYKRTFTVFPDSGEKYMDMLGLI